MSKLFIPMTFAKSGKKYFDDKRFIILFAVTLLFLLSLGIIATIHSDLLFQIPILETKYFLWLLWLIDFYFYILFFRIYVIREKTLKAVYARQRANHITTMKPFWSIFEMEDNKLLYIDGRVATLVVMQRGHIFGRHPNHREYHFRKYSDCLGELILLGYQLRTYNLQIPDANTEGLNTIQQGMSHLSNTKMYKYQSEIYNFVRHVCNSVSTLELDYILVMGNTMQHILHLTEHVENALTTLNGTLMCDARMANLEEIHYFTQQYYRLGYVDIQELLKTQVYRDKVNLVEILQTFYAQPSAPSVQAQTQPIHIPQIDAEAALRYQKLLEDEAAADEARFAQPASAPHIPPYPAQQQAPAVPYAQQTPYSREDELD